MSPRKVFESELALLHANLEEMGQLVENGLDQLFDAQAKQDKEMLETLRKNDRIVNDMERQIESKCLSLITKQQPVARDLRTISAAMKVVTDLERAGDQISDVAELLLRLNMVALEQYSSSFPQMIKETQEILHLAVDAFINRDLEGSRNAVSADDSIDDLFNKVKEDIISDVRENLITPDECADSIMIAKYLEKIADYAVNIGEWGIFQKTGNIEDVRIL